MAIPIPLKQEFATVEALWHSTGETKRVDALVLSWVKYEKQLRRLFCFLLFQHPKITKKNIEQVVGVLAKERNLYPDTFIAAIAALGVTSVPDLLGRRHAELAPEILRIKKYRNKLIHGQVSGQGIKSPQLERDVLCIMRWVHCLAGAAELTFGYDGLKRNTFRQAKTTARIAVDKYPFATPDQLAPWLAKLAKRVRR